MSESRSRGAGATLLPELPKDVPMPRYRYQRDERSSDTQMASEMKQKAASLLAGLHLMGCAAAEKI